LVFCFLFHWGLVAVSTVLQAKRLKVIWNEFFYSRLFNFTWEHFFVTNERFKSAEKIFIFLHTTYMTYFKEKKIPLEGEYLKIFGAKSGSRKKGSQ
jgi:hypothetical protein